MIGVLSAGAATGGESLASLLPMIVIWVVVVGGMMYFMSIKPQKKERQRMQELMSSLELGGNSCSRVWKQQELPYPYEEDSYC